jgi:hypothetical protein
MAAGRHADARVGMIRAGCVHASLAHPRNTEHACSTTAEPPSVSEKAQVVQAGSGNFNLAHIDDAESCFDEGIRRVPARFLLPASSE